MSDETQNGTPAFEDDYEPDIITLEDESGKEHTFEVLDAAEVDGQRYFAVVPYSEKPDERLSQDAEMLIMRVGEENGDEYLDIVDDEEELHRTGQVFLSRLSEVYNIDLDELQRQMDADDEKQ